MLKIRLVLNILLSSILIITYASAENRVDDQAIEKQSTTDSIFDRPPTLPEIIQACDPSSEITIEIVFLFSKQISNFFSKNRNCTEHFLKFHKLIGPCTNFGKTNIHDQLLFRICNPYTKISSFTRFTASSFQLNDRKFRIFNKNPNPNKNKKILNLTFFFPKWLRF